MKNIYDIKVTWGDTDAAAIVFYPNFYKWMDQATHELFAAADLSILSLQKEENIILPLLETFCQFKSPLEYDDRVSIHSEVTEINKKVFTITHQFKKGDHVVAEGYEKRAWTKAEDGAPPKAAAMPAHIQDVLLG
ncbi:acyl-CoA thioester hydrolase [Alteribacillus persepolensis]|uniref:Acyl-CoA thioester hydrolase n=1 Tax=Alteribacillus persepolensis TaxID=568899 RepID=A0A1G8A8V8_9BACI|nr:acyl-CoA thioesterase [Alteribacillus persepolensis]SDH17306.1 acyl-CoA thioester hydrolase [Alteribacillus persepolensis]